MKEFSSLGLRYIGRRLEVLDQRLLPHDEVWRHVDHPREMERLIQQLSIRGAPLIGVGAAVMLALYAEHGASAEHLHEAADFLRKSRPTAVNLVNAVNLIADHFGNTGEMVAAAEQLIDAEIQRSKAMAEHGAELLEDGDAVITHCNTGGLATVGVGTALGVIQYAHQQGKDIHVYVSETRPLLQGARLTAWELERLNIPYTLICDNMSALIMRDGRATRVLVGADRIALNGDFANKVGTYGLAVLAAHHRIPFHCVAPTSTLDVNCATGSAIAIELRGADEVRGVKGFFGNICWSPPASEVYNPCFDVTPVELVTSLILDTGIYERQNLIKGILKTLVNAEGVPVS